MSINIIAGSTWGRRPWATPVYSVPMTERLNFLVHYDGGTPVVRTGFSAPMAVDNGHHGNGWAGIGYNFLVDQAGNIYEGRGWNLVGAHCPGFNRNGIGVQVAIGGSQEPTEAAKAAVVAIYTEACRLSGHGLAKTYHGAHYPTACAGSRLIPWVQAGMQLLGRAPALASPSRSVVNVIRKALGKLAVDGIFGPATVTAWQKVMHTPVDGVISKPSSLVKAVQERVGTNPDGVLGPVTWKAIQRRLGVAADGTAGPITISALQRRLNSNTF